MGGPTFARFMNPQVARLHPIEMDVFTNLSDGVTTVPCPHSAIKGRNG